MPRFDDAGGILTIDLGAIIRNYEALRERAPGAEVAAVVKADAYGLGMAEVARALEAAGCRTFYVATVDEGAELRRVLPTAEIAVFNGVLAGSEMDFAEHRLIPVLNDLGQIDRWAAFARGWDEMPAILHVDTGMNRLGLPPHEAEALAAMPERLDGMRVRCVISHLACADDPEAEMNRRQLDLFRAITARLPRRPRGLAASGGIFLGPEYHFDQVRPGIALYGVAPDPGRPNPMAPVVHLAGRILQVRDVDSPMAVGYGATHRVTRPSRIATVAVGYADGYVRSLSNQGRCFIGDVPVPVVGRVSMDSITLDVSGVAETEALPGMTVEVIGPHRPVDDLAREAGTIGYEILTGLGRRFFRRYVGGPA